MNIYEKGGDFLLDLSKLVIGAVILGGIMAEGFSNSKLYWFGTIIAIGVIAVVFVLFNIKPKRKDNYYGQFNLFSRISRHYECCFSMHSCLCAR